ncbi:ScbR family autoregulator-binding transcription factor [Streptomyces sp. NBC_01089]|uniref:ScbR family autoregulator-binding transcription factor n=1 Tax=Streptomyces sp. NBC_01089 TaxID=2903747 RepID=UPI0038667A07|nr:TetR/AcrR family transcriptional regulator [Streptomyces sp. NBC_01089]WSU46283.1 TetR/AcrR family transcriptional regulator [Streptomyces sp. NBC_01089]
MQDRSERTRRRLLEEGAKLLTRSGYAHTTLGQIAAAAGMTKGALYFHFTSKEGLADAVREQGRVRLLDFLGERRDSGDEPVQILIDLTHWLARARREDAVVRAAFRLSDDGTDGRPESTGLRRIWLDEAVRLLGEAEAAGQLSEAARGDGIRTLLVAMLYGIAAPGPDGPAQAGAPRGTAELWRLLLTVLVAPGRAGHYRTAPPRTRYIPARAA